MLTAATAAIEQARRNGDLIITIGSEFKRGDALGNLVRRGAAVQGSLGTRWDPRIEAEDAVYLPKWRRDAFCNPALEDLLVEHQVEQVALAGLYAHACVTATAKMALARGLKVEIVRAGVADRNDKSRARSLARLAKRGATIL
jgi:nicotinamidase-related amidase